MEAPDFFVEDLLDLPNGDEMMSDAYFDSSAAANSTDSSTVTPVDSCNSADNNANLNSDFHSRPFPDAHFSGELCVPYDDVAQLEWLSNFVEESFSSEDLHKHHLINTGAGPGPVHRHGQFRPEPESTLLRPDGSVPGRARSKLSRVAPSDWSTRLLMVNNSSTDMAPPKKAVKKRAEVAADEMEVRRCMHCAAEKTPQWRTGPMGPKTLCNACGVRYKSGRLVPEYRPAASPTFMSTKHSNSHRKVLELRRQNDVVQRHPLHHHHHQFLGGGASSGGYGGGGSGGDDYLIHHHVGPDFRQLI